MWLTVEALNYLIYNKKDLLLVCKNQKEANKDKIEI